MTTITEGQWSQFVDQTDSEERRAYSGRGMYGKTCPAIVTDLSVFYVGCHARDVFGEDAFELEPTMGPNGFLGSVLYFPNLEIVEDY